MNSSTPEQRRKLRWTILLRSTNPAKHRRPVPAQLVDDNTAHSQASSQIKPRTPSRLRVSTVANRIKVSSVLPIFSSTLRTLRLP
jgi:hypothetical protein